MPKKTRLDTALTARQIVPSRAKAQALIMARRVLVNGEIVAKAGKSVTDEDRLELLELEHPWVGRGGMKLDRALDHFQIDLRGMRCADIGASTGGFTDVMLSHGAARVYAIDVGYGQLDPKLRDDDRVVVMERTNARYLETGDIEPIDLASIDVSFISLELIIPAVLRVAGNLFHLVALIKPQFEAGREGVGKGGIVRDSAVREEVIARITEFCQASGLHVAGVIESPVRGAEGNVEYLLYARKGNGNDEAETVAGD